MSIKFFFESERSKELKKNAGNWVEKSPFMSKYALFELENDIKA